MATISQIVTRFAEEAGQPDARLLRGLSGNVFVSPHDDRVLCSYDTSFPLAQIMPGELGTRSWWLLNGDTYSYSTSTHQRLTREACEKTLLPVLILPFSCLRAAGIDRESIEPVDIRADQWRELAVHAPSADQVPQWYRDVARQLPDGTWQWTVSRHLLGASVFRAAYTTYEGADWRRVTRTAYFLSAFDEQEPSPLYFLCQLPDDAVPSTVAGALQALKPPEVTAAEEGGRTVTRQGDVFAVPEDVPTRLLPGPTRRGDYLLGLTHTASEVRTGHDGVTYARGILRHAPGHGRRPEHVRQPMGDRKTWHRIVRNTVPVDHRGQQRSWSLAGNVD
jgi:hypothetical protein